MRCRVCSPWPGRIARTFCAVKGSPHLTVCTMKSDRRKTRLFASFSLTPKCTSPSAFSAMRTASTIALNSAGSSEKALSGPGTERESVKCFSMMHAPSATAATGAAIPMV